MMRQRGYQPEKAIIPTSNLTKDSLLFRNRSKPNSPNPKAARARVLSMQDNFITNLVYTNEINNEINEGCASETNE